MPKYTIIIETEDFELNNVQKEICEQIKFLIQGFKELDQSLSEKEAADCASLVLERGLSFPVTNKEWAKEIIEIAKSRYPIKK
jgi:hypothetical protein